MSIWEKLKATLAKAFHFALGVIRDPNSLDASSMRIYGGMLILSGIGVAIYGAWSKTEHAATVATLTTTGTAALGLRAKSTPSAP